MLAAALVPDTALVVPGAGGSSDVLADVRRAALEAVAETIAARPDRLVVVAGSVPGGGSGSTEHLTGPLRPTFTAAGIPDDQVGLGEGASPRGSHAVAHVGASVGIWLVRQVGWAADLEVVLLDDVGADDARAVGRALAPGRSALVLVGSLSARHGPGSPLPEDERAPEVDARVVADLVDGSAAALDRLARVPARLARELAISAWGPWQVLVGALSPPVPGRVHHVGRPPTSGPAVLSWSAR